MKVKRKGKLMSAKCDANQLKLTLGCFVRSQHELQLLSWSNKCVVWLYTLEKCLNFVCSGANVVQQRIY